MVAVIKFSSSLRNVVHYNENKLKQEVPRKDVNEPRKMKAEFIHASGFAKDTEKLGFTDKFKRLEKQMKLNEGRKKSVVHISLNFDPSEQLTRERLQQIADTYMQKIGFGKQPYLVYQHHDSGHPHIHIVSTIIRNDGSPIDTHNIGRNISEPARKEIEDLFDLVKADAHKQKEAFRLQPLIAQKVLYGKSETKRAITNVLDFVLYHYKYTSLSELNAVLKYYNLVADPGTEKSRVHRNKGLVYRVLDEQGNKTGVPIKASDLYNNPGLKFLEDKFLKNESLRIPFKAKIKNAIDLALKKTTVTSLDDLKNALQRDKIQMVIRQNEEGRIYGLTFIDHQSKSVFNGSDLGKNYSASFILERLAMQTVQSLKETEKQKPQILSETRKRKKEKQSSGNTAQQKIPFKVEPITPHISPAATGNTLLEELTKPEYGSDSIPSELKRKKKRKKRRIHL
jgi:hypothetical protein